MALGAERQRTVDGFGGNQCPLQTAQDFVGLLGLSAFGRGGTGPVGSVVGPPPRRAFAERRTQLRYGSGRGARSIGYAASVRGGAMSSIAKWLLFSR